MADRQTDTMILFHSSLIEYTSEGTKLESGILTLPTFLSHAMTSSLRIARSSACNWNVGCTKHRATAIMEAVNTPFTPTVVRNSAMLGVKRNGTGRLASSSPKMNQEIHVVIHD